MNVIKKLSLLLLVSIIAALIFFYLFISYPKNESAEYNQCVDESYENHMDRIRQECANLGEDAVYHPGQELCTLPEDISTSLSNATIAESTKCIEDYGSFSLKIHEKFGY